MSATWRVSVGFCEQYKCTIRQIRRNMVPKDVPLNLTDGAHADWLCTFKMSLNLLQSVGGFSTAILSITTSATCWKYYWFMSCINKKWLLIMHVTPRTQPIQWTCTIKNSYLSGQFVTEIERDEDDMEVGGISSEHGAILSEIWFERVRPQFTSRFVRSGQFRSRTPIVDAIVMVQDSPCRCHEQSDCQMLPIFLACSTHV